MDPYIGEIKLVPYNFAPLGWAFCQGQTVSIAQNPALFSLIGTTYGGNGVSSFNLPDLQGRVPIHRSNNFVPGAVGGSESVSLTEQEVPPHTHGFAIFSDLGNQTTTSGTFVAASPHALHGIFRPSGNSIMNPNSVGATGNSSSHENMQPFLVLNYVIALVGVFPPRG